MNLDKVLFYNLGAMEEVPGLGKNGLMRFPERIRNRLSDKGRYVAMESAGIEAQFVTDANIIDVYVSSQKPELSERASIRVYKGNFLYKIFEFESGKVHNFRLTPPVQFNNVRQTMLRTKGFSPSVWRIVCDRSVTILHGIDTHGYEIRKPEKNELPPRNWLAYGSSITNASLDGYAFVAAKQLGIQVQNKGLRGSCHMEKAVVDYMFDELEFDFITCELGVNMRGKYTPEEFEERARYLVERMAESKKPSAIITIFPNGRSADYIEEPVLETEREQIYNNILADLVKEAGSPNIHLIHGYEILTDVSGLNADLLHPSSYGHAVMGLNLANILRKLNLT